MNISIPSKAEILKGGISVAVVPKGGSWSESRLGELTKAKGVYIFHHNQSIKYIGKTNGKSMNFGMRLRRHLQETAASKKHTYPKLAQLIGPPSIEVKLIPLDEIKRLIKHDLKVINELDLIPLFEAALIVAYQPEFQCDSSII